MSITDADRAILASATQSRRAQMELAQDLGVQPIRLAMERVRLARDPDAIAAMPTECRAIAERVEAARLCRSAARLPRH